MNFLALLGWSYDDKTTVMSRDELVERFSLERVGPSPATFDYAKLDWLNGVYLRELDRGRVRRARCSPGSASRGSTGPRSASAQTVPLVQEKFEKLSQYPDYVRFLFEPVEPGRRRPGRLRARPPRRSGRVEPWDAAAIEEALRGSPRPRG